MLAEEAEDLFDSLSVNYVFGNLESAFSVYGLMFRANAVGMNLQPEKSDIFVSKG